MPTKVSKICSGLYEVKDGERKVEVAFFEKADGASFTGWVARATWTHGFYSDPLATKREAVREAEAMLANPY
jgi:hypothetical protein